MDDPKHSKSHSNFAGRLPAGTELPVTLKKNGVRHVQKRCNSGEQKEVLSVGLACSECFSGKNLYKILKPGFEYERKVMEALMNGESAGPLSIHTSSGVPEALADFLVALEPHLPWKNIEQELDWCASLQLEGASAVWAAIDMVLQVRMFETGDKTRTKVAVATTSYHGPPSTSFGSSSPLWRKENQLKYPAPLAGEIKSDDELLDEFTTFLNNHALELGVILFEPQWGSSQAAMPWPRDLLKRYIQLSKEHGLKVICDEIMCGLGRHGKKKFFVSEAWDLDPDAVTFGKAIGAGVYPLSGAILKQGREVLRANKCTVMQSHTYAGSSTRALMAATEVVKELPTWFASIEKLGDEMRHIFNYISKISQGLVSCHGQGLMWGGVFSRDGQCKDEDFRKSVIASFKRNCDELGILPYHVPVGGFMVSPVIDIDVGTIYEIGEKLEHAVIQTMKDVSWIPIIDFEDTTEASAESDSNSLSECGISECDDDDNSSGEFITRLAEEISKGDMCVPILHKTRSCTSCSSFVSKGIRTKFLNV